jgi:hypothetical protein
MEYKVKPGDLVQSNIFNKEGSGSYGLVMGPYGIPGYWSIKWCDSDWELSEQIVGIYEVHEKDIVVVSSS